MMSGWQEWPNSPVQRGQSDPRVALDHALRTETAWAREARVILRLAAERGLCLDAQSLLLGDVHDLQALRHELQSQPIPSAHARRAELPRLTRVLAQRSAARAGTTGNS